MHVECSACGARYVIADEKIPIQGARVRCRKCQAVFSIERSAPAPPAPAELPLIPPTPQAAAPAPPPEAAPAAPSPFGAPAASSRFDTSPFESAPVGAPAPPAPSRFDTSPFEAAPASAPPEIEKFANAFASSAPAPPVAPPPPPAQAAPPPPPQAASSPPPPPEPAASVSRFSPSAGSPPGLPEAERLKHERARRLARVLASDIAIYNKEKRDRGVKDGNLVAVLGYEIKKSWEVYKERVTAEMANSTPYFRDALNEMLAEGKKVF